VCVTHSWLELLAPGRAIKLLVLLSAVLLYAMNTLLASTIAPSAIREFGGIAYVTWPTAAFLASSITAASAVGILTVRIGARRGFIVAGVVFGLGALICALSNGMAQLITGRFIQGAGGGLLSGLSYVLVRRSFPEGLWPRAFAAISGVWGIAVLFGPLIGGVFANAGSWRGAFYFVAIAAAVLSIVAAIALERDPATSEAGQRVFPIGRLSLVCLSIAAICAAQVTAQRWLVVALIVLAMAAVIAMLRRDRSAPGALFPSDAFSTRSVVGLGLWMALLLSVANDPFSLYGPLFLQELHGLSPLSAGYMVALEALSWTLAAVIVTSYSQRREFMLIIAGPLIMSAGLAGIAWRMPAGTIAQLLAPIFCSGAGIGACWAFMAQRVMKAARAGEADVAASSVATVQLYGFAFGGAIAGLIANLVGYSAGLTPQATRSAALWVPASFVIATLAAAVAGARLVALERGRVQSTQ
jgi:MFS family permease